MLWLPDIEICRVWTLATGYLVTSTPLSTVRTPTLPSAVRLGWSMELSSSLPRVVHHHHHHGGGAGRGMRAPPAPSPPLLSPRPSPRLCPSFITITVFSNHCSSKPRTSARPGLSISHTQAGHLLPAPHWTPEVGARPGAELLWSWPLHNTVLLPRRRGDQCLAEAGPASTENTVTGSPLTSEAGSWWRAGCRQEPPEQQPLVLTRRKYESVRRRGAGELTLERHS